MVGLLKGGTLVVITAVLWSGKQQTVKNCKHTNQPEMEPMIKGLLNKRTLLDVIRHFSLFTKKPKKKQLKKLLHTTNIMQ